MLGYACLHPQYDSMLRAPLPGEIEAIAPLIEAAEAYEERRLAVLCQNSSWCLTCGNVNGRLRPFAWWSESALVVMSR